MSQADDARAILEASAEAAEWLIRLRSGHATPADLQAYRRWCAEHPEHAVGVRMMHDAWSTLRTVGSEIIDALPDERPTAALARLRQAPARALRPGRRAFVGFAVAAGASWLALRPPLQLWPALGDFAADYRTGTGEQRQVALSDQVTVEMNTQTRINVLSAHAGQTARRGIDLLAGEAEIVANAVAIGRTSLDHPVVVTAGRGKLQADVARFDIRRTGNTVCVTCVSGAVALAHPQRRATLLAGQQLVYDDQAVQSLERVDTTTATAWRRGMLIFKRAPLTEVVDEINRYRPGKVILRNAALSEKKVEAQVFIADMDGAVDMLANLYDMHITKLPGNITLLS